MLENSPSLGWMPPSVERWSVLKLLIGLEAAIGIEPMNKGFAVRSGPLSLSIVECHWRVNIKFIGWLCLSVTLSNTADSAQKSPQ